MKVYFCTTAPSKNYKSWSNIPYLLHKNLEKKGFVVLNYVMKEVEPFKTIFNFPVRVLNKIFKVGTTYYYVRTPVHFFFTYLYSQFIGLISDKQDVMLVQGFSYPLSNKKNRQIILGDWPSEYLFEKFLKRKPSQLERISIDQENAVIEAADAVVTLFPNVREYMLQKYQNKNIYYFGNVINVDETIKIPDDILQRKKKSNRFLFIGQPFYINGALELIEAVRNLRRKGADFEVDIVGIAPNLLNLDYSWLKVYGYLDKEKEQDKKIYYELLSNAKMFVNTTNGWVGFQALLEAMYFYNPIVVRPNEMLTSYFSNLNEISFALEEGGAQLEELLLKSHSDDLKYEQMCLTARQTVEPYSWNQFTNKIVRLFK